MVEEPSAPNSPSNESPIAASLLDENMIAPMVAHTLEKLLRHHRATCSGDCYISLGLMIPTYERLLKRQITQAEFRELFQ